MKKYLVSGGKALSAQGEIDLELPWEYRCLRASRYSKSVPPWTWETGKLTTDPETAREWMEYGLLAESVENEIQAEELAKSNPKQARTRAPMHQAFFNQE